MRITLFSVLTILFLTLVCLPVSFAQNPLSENVIRVIYFLPNDRAPQPDIDTMLDREIKDAQLLFADLLESHGFGRKTFRFETDANGDAVVHRVNGKFAAVHYHNSPWSVWDELTEQFDLSKNIYLASIDTGILNPVPDPEGNFFVCFSNGICGHGGWGNEGASGRAVVPTNDDPAVAHELGHAFGLQHDYRNYLGLQHDYRPHANNNDPTLISFCAAEWLDANRYFNETSISSNNPTTIQMLPPLPAPSYAIRLRFEIKDLDGLHQAQLHADITDPNQMLGGRQIIDYESLSGESNTVEFVTSKLSGGATTAITKVWLQVTDAHGNFTEQEFSIDVTSVLPSPEVVSIPDANLAAAVRRHLNINPGDAITQLDMLALIRRLEGSGSEIVDLTGLEHAVNLRDLSLFSNRISDLRPLAGLTQLRHLGLAYNQIHDISPLAGLTQLTTLNLNHNQIHDVTPLAGLTQLEELRLEYNQIRDASSLTKLVNVKTLFLGGNPLTTIPGVGVVDIGMVSDEVLVIESDNFVVCSRETHDPVAGTVGGIRLSPTDPIKVKSLNFDPLLHNDNLTGFFERGGTIELVTLTSASFGDVVISEIMWGLNGDSTADQWIELYNTIPNAITLDLGSWGAGWAFRFRYDNNGEWENVQGLWKVIDRVSNRDWKVPGQSGNTVQKQPLVSMYRMINYETGDVPDGTLASSWRASTGRVNLLPPSYGTPGAKHLPSSPVVLVGTSQRPPMYWVDTNTGTLHRLIGAKVEHLVPGVQNTASLAVDTAGGKLYWGEKTSDRTGKIRRANLDGTNVQLIKDLTSVPIDLAIDTTNNKLYLTNSWGKVQRFNFNGSNFQSNLITNLDSPKNITVDIADGKLYWTEQTDDTTGSIQRANFNGSNIQLVKDLTSGPHDLAIDPVNGKLYVANSFGKIQRLNLDGSSFQPNLITGLDSPEGLAVDVAGGKLYWTEHGSIRRSDLNGENIQNVVIGLGTPTDLILEIPPIDTRVQAAPAGVGPFLGETRLHPNYPNPFNPETWIPYRLAAPASVTLTIYAVNGQIVRTLDLGHQRAGIYQSKSRAAYWDGRNAQGEPVASGVYFYTLKAGDFSATRKMLIRK